MIPIPRLAALLGHHGHQKIRFDDILRQVGLKITRVNNWGGVADLGLSQRTS